MMAVRFTAFSALATLAFVLGVTGTSPAQLKAGATPPPPPPCIADPSGIVDFEGQLGSAGGNSNVKILQASDVTEYYVDMITSQFGSAGTPQKRIESVSDLKDIERRSSRVPAALAAAHTALFIAGNFKCIGFSPGRYIFLSEVFGGKGHVGDAPAAVVYYRADVDVSSLKRHSIVVVRGFRRIGSYPPGS